MRATSDLLDAWADLVHGSACLGCGMPGRPWCRSCAAMLARGGGARSLEVGIRGVTGACAGDYEGWLRDLILAHKEDSAWALATPLGILLARAVALAGGGAPLLVPVPSSRASVRRRGHDPMRRVTRVAAAVLRSQGLDARMMPFLRLRLPVRDSVGLTVGQRRRNLADAFAVSPGALRSLRRQPDTDGIVVCDDVITTGTTAREACAALALAGIPAIGVATIAAVQRPEQTSQVNPQGIPSAGLDGALTSCHGVRPGPWLRRDGGNVPDSASRCQSQAKRST